ncbi:MAG: hypothetical protein WDM96_12290 [Lacunisphaera sp.]
MNDTRTGAARIRAAGRNPYETCAIGNGTVTVSSNRYNVKQDGRIYDELAKAYIDVPPVDPRHEKVAKVLTDDGGVPAIDVDELTVKVLTALDA